MAATRSGRHAWNRNRDAVCGGIRGGAAAGLGAVISADLVGQLLASSRLDFETLNKRSVVAGELWGKCWPGASCRGDCR
jgi:hypothetical protein